MEQTKTSTKVILAIEAILAAAAVIVICLAEIYVDQHPIKALIQGFSMWDMVPIAVCGFIAASIISIVLTKTVAAIKAAVDKKKKSKKRKAKKAAK